MPTVHLRRSEQFRPEELAELKDLFERAYGYEPGASKDEDWAQGFGGVHLFVRRRGSIVAHASVVDRELHAQGHELRTGYVEAVATDPPLQGSGLGTAVMLEVNRYIDAHFPLGALATGSARFYQRLGWWRWIGPTSVRTEGGVLATPEEDGNVFVRRTRTSPVLDRSAPISCEWRPGEIW